MNVKIPELIHIGGQDINIEIVDNICAEAKPTDDNGTITPADQPVIDSVTIRTE